MRHLDDDSRFGVMLQPGSFSRPDLRLNHWAVDNGCYAHPERFDLNAYLDYVLQLIDFKETCLFVTLPDVPRDWRQTLDRSTTYLSSMSALGLPLAFVAQDGMPVDLVPWDAVRAVFVGGSDDWLDGGCADILREAGRRGKWRHLGRTNTLRRLKIAMRLCCDSVDGTYLKFGPTVNLPKLRRMMETVHLHREYLLEG